MKLFIICLIIPVVYFVSSCSEEISDLPIDLNKVESNLEETIVLRQDTLIGLDYNGRTIDVFIKRATVKRKGSILALPGWNYPYSHWLDSTEFCIMAITHGYDVVLPSMGKTIYSNSIYSQTRLDWQKEITRPWINSTLIPVIQNDGHSLLDIETNFIIGLSTGGRGAVLLAMDNPELFNAGASLSGDFDMVTYKNDALYRGFFGDYQNNRDIWEGIENPLTRVNELKTPFYIAHGELDRIVPAKHSMVLYEALDSNNCVLGISMSDKHNYAFWNKSALNAFEYFKANE